MAQTGSCIKFGGNFVAIASVSPPDDAEAWSEIDELCDEGFAIQSTQLNVVETNGIAAHAILYVVLQYSNAEQYFAEEHNKQNNARSQKRAATPNPKPQ